MSSLAILVINGQDFSGLVARNGITVTYEQRQSKEVITLDGTAHVAWIEKASLAITMHEMPYERVNALNSALIGRYVQVKYQDPKSGIVIKTFYVMDKNFGVKVVEAGRTYYDGISFTLKER